MGKIYKANQVSIDSDKRVLISTGQKMTTEKLVAKVDPAEEEFIESMFRELSPEHLAGSGEKMSTQKEVDEESKSSEDNNDNAEETSKVESEKVVATPVKPSLKLSSKKARYKAAIDTIRRKELELEALEEELRSWEDEIKAKENKLSEREQQIHNDMMKKRTDCEAQTKSMIDMAKTSSDTMTNTAKAEAEVLKKNALLEIENDKAKAHKEGFALGESKGLSAGEEQGLHEARLDWQNLMKETEMLINELQTSRMGILKASEEEMVRIVIAFAKSVIKVEPLAQPEIILKNIDAAINRVSDVDKIVMRINIKDKSMCQAHKDSFMQRLNSVAELQIIEDSTLSPGGIKIETGVGTIDATIESQAKELEKALLNKLSRVIS